MTYLGLSKDDKFIEKLLIILFVDSLHMDGVAVAHMTDKVSSAHCKVIVLVITPINMQYKS